MIALETIYMNLLADNTGMLKSLENLIRSPAPETPKPN